LAETASRPDLENALSLYAARDREGVAKSFLEALSVDELLFLAEFLGSCILITSTVNIGTWNAVAHRAKAVHRGLERMTPKRREDFAHKLIVLSEFAACCGFMLKHRP